MYLYIGRGFRLWAWWRSPVLRRLGKMLCHKPGKAWPALEVHNMILALLLGESLGCGFTGQGHRDPQTPQQEPNLLATWVLQIQTPLTTSTNTYSK